MRAYHTSPQPALECLLDEKAELAKHAAALETRLREAEAAAAAGSRATLSPAEEGVRSELGQGTLAGKNADTDGGERGAFETATVNAGGPSLEGTPPPASAQDTTPQQQQHRWHRQLVPRQGEIAAGQSRAEADRLRDELERARVEQADAAAAAAEERRVASSRVSELEAAIAGTKREYQDHRDRAESRLETLRVAFEQENEENDPQVK